MVRTSSLLRLAGLSALVLVGSAFGPGGCHIGQPCPDVACMMYCPHGFAHDKDGCAMCSCEKASCTADSDCGAGEVCIAGTCEVQSKPCDQLGYDECTSRSDCQPIFVRDCAGPDASCPPIEDKSAFAGCEPKTKACTPGQDWTCNDDPAMNAIAGTCRADGTCECGPWYSLNPATGRCGPLVCTEPVCAIDCAYGFVKDGRGCDTCTCAPAPCTDDTQCASGDKCLSQSQCGPVGKCLSDGDCSSSQRCQLYAVDCVPDMPCPVVLGDCVANPLPGCSSDVDCALDQYCVLANAVDVGVCQPLPECVNDSACPAGTTCSPTNCAPMTNCGLGGQCVHQLCTTDADCMPGHDCRPDPTDPCNSTGMACLMPGRMTCQPAVRCTKDLDCQMGELCLPDPTDPCNTDPTIQCFAMGRQICIATHECASVADCGADRVCVDDPKDPCLTQACGRREILFCEKSCGLLGEDDCLSRPDCHAVYAQLSGSAAMAFDHCE